MWSLNLREIMFLILEIMYILQTMLWLLCNY